MYHTEIDSIVNNYLLQKGLTIHNYVRCLSFALECLIEIELDLCGKVYSEKLTVNQFNEVKLPCNYVDFLRIGTENGQYIVNLGITKNFNRKLNLQDGVLQQFGETNASTTSLSYPSDIYDWFNEHGEYTGREFGGNGTRIDEVMVNEERGVITLNRSFVVAGDKIDLDYIAAEPADADTKIHRYAEATINAYIDWRYEKHLPVKNAFMINSAKDEYDNQLRILAARKSDLTPDVVSQILNRKFRQAVIY